MFRTHLLTVAIAGAAFALSLPTAKTVHACTGSANDPTHCINNNQAISGYSDFFFNNLQDPCSGGSCGAGSSFSPVAPLGGTYGDEFIGTELNFQKRFSSRWQALGGFGTTTLDPNFSPAGPGVASTGCGATGDCSVSPGGSFYGGGPNSGYLCDAGGPGCGSDGFTPQGFDFTSAGNFNNPFASNLTSGPIDPFGGASDGTYINPRTGETVNFDPDNPPPEVAKIQELISAYANGEIAYPFYEDWENRPVEDFRFDNPNGVGGVPANQQPGAGTALSGSQNVPVFAAPQPLNLSAIPTNLINSHPYQQNATQGAFDPFGGGEGIFLDPRTGLSETFDPSNPPDHVKKAQELNDAYAEGKINYPFYEDWRTRPQSDFDPDGKDLGGIGQTITSELDDRPLFPGATTGGTSGSAHSTTASGTRDPRQNRNRNLLGGESVFGGVFIGARGQNNNDRFDRYMVQVLASAPPVANTNAGGAQSTGQTQPKQEESIIDSIVSNVGGVFRRSDEDRKKLEQQRRERDGTAGNKYQHYKFEVHGGSDNNSLNVRITDQDRVDPPIQGVDPVTKPLDATVNRSGSQNTQTETSTDPALQRVEGSLNRDIDNRPEVVSRPPAPTGEKVGQLAYQQNGQRLLVDVIRTEDGRTLAVGTGENAGHVFGEAKEGKWGYRREGPWTPPPAQPAPTSTTSSTQASNSGNTGGRQGADCDNCQVVIPPSKLQTGRYYISISVANSDRDAMTQPDFAEGFESGDTSRWSSVGN